MSARAWHHSRTAFHARIRTQRVRGEALFSAQVLFHRKIVFTIAERPSEHLVRADLADWAWTFGKQLRFES